MPNHKQLVPSPFCCCPCPSDRLSPPLVVPVYVELDWPHITSTFIHMCLSLCLSLCLPVFYFLVSKTQLETSAAFSYFNMKWYINHWVDEIAFPRKYKSNFAQKFSQYFLQPDMWGWPKYIPWKNELKIIHSSLCIASPSLVYCTFLFPQGSQYTGLNP